MQDALSLLDPIPDAAEDLAAMVDRIITARQPGGLTVDWNTNYNVRQFAEGRIPLRPAAEKPALMELALNLDPGLPPF